MAPALTTQGGAINSVPDWVRERARGLWSVVDHTTPVADLVSDTLLDGVDGVDRVDGDPALVDTRTVRFARSGGQRATVTVNLQPGDVDLVFSVVPPQRTCVDARFDDGSSYQFVTDDSGRATVAALPAGVITFVVVEEASREALWRTAWLRY